MHVHFKEFLEKLPTRMFLNNIFFSLSFPQEMVEVKKLDPAVADKIGVLIQKKGVLDLVEELEGSELSQNKNVAVKTYLMFEKIPWEFLKKSKLSV